MVTKSLTFINPWFFDALYLSLQITLNMAGPNSTINPLHIKINPNNHPIHTTIVLRHTYIGTYMN